MITRWILTLVSSGSLALTLSAEDAEVPSPPEGGFVNEKHEKLHEEYFEGLHHLDLMLEAERTQLDLAFGNALENRIFDLALTIPPDRLREIQKLTADWIGARGSVSIGEEIPAELEGIVRVHRFNLEKREAFRGSGQKSQLESLIRGLDSLTTELSKEPEMREKMLALRDEAASLMPLRVAPARWGKLEVTTFQWLAGEPRFVRMQRNGDELCALAMLRGNFAGGGETVSIYHGPDPGTFGLAAHSLQNTVKATAYALRDPRLKLDTTDISVKQIGGDTTKQKLIHHSRGFCYLSGIWGNYGSKSKCDVAIDPEDGFYYLSGKFENPYAGGRAIIIEYPEDAVPDFELKTVGWNRGEPTCDLIEGRDGICLLTGFSGILRGGAEQIRVMIDADGIWRLGGRSRQTNTGAKALVLRFEK